MKLRYLVALGLVAAALIPLSNASTQQAYVGGAGGAAALCTAPGIAGGCGFECGPLCEVSVVDSTLGPASFRVCDWDGTHSTNCTDGRGSTEHVSHTGVVDVFVVLGTRGTVTVTPLTP